MRRSLANTAPASNKNHRATTAGPAHAHLSFRHPNNRAGKNKIARNKAKTAPNVIPINRNGSDKIQISGHKTNAKSASGQHNTNKMHHPIKASIVVPFHKQNTPEAQKFHPFFPEFISGSQEK